MNKFSLFTDVSLNPKLKLGFGSYLLILDIELKMESDDFFYNKIKLKKFESTSSTKLEIETLLWALDELGKMNKNFIDNLKIYTDSQCIVGLSNRRERLESLDFISTKKNTLLKNGSLYQKFFQLNDKYKFKIIKLKGHSKSISKDLLHKTFSHVDKASRKALKNYIKENFGSELDANMD